MAVISSSIAALSILRKYKCPHCGAVQDRLMPRKGMSLECQNCLRSFEPTHALVCKSKTGRRKR